MEPIQIFFFLRYYLRSRFITISWLIQNSHLTLQLIQFRWNCQISGLKIDIFEDSIDVYVAQNVPYMYLCYGCVHIYIQVYVTREPKELQVRPDRQPVSSSLELSRRIILKKLTLQALLALNVLSLFLFLFLFSFLSLAHSLTHSLFDLFIFPLRRALFFAFFSSLS